MEEIKVHWVKVSPPKQTPMTHENWETLKRMRFYTDNEHHLKKKLDRQNPANQLLDGWQKLFEIYEIFQMFHKYQAAATKNISSSVACDLPGFNME